MPPRNSISEAVPADITVTSVTKVAHTLSCKIAPKKITFKLETGERKSLGINSTCTNVKKPFPRKGKRLIRRSESTLHILNHAQNYSNFYSQLFENLATGAPPSPFLYFLLSCCSSSDCHCEWPELQYACKEKEAESLGGPGRHQGTTINTKTTNDVHSSSQHSSSLKIMSLHHHHQQQQQHQVQQQHQQPPSTSTTTATTQATATSTVVTTTVSLVHHQQRSSSTSPHHQLQQQQQQQQQRHSFQQRHQHHHLHHYIPPRPPSTNSSGSISTGFPDDLQDDIPLPPTPVSVGGTPAEQYSFHPATHSRHHHSHHAPPSTLQYHRHTSPHYSAQQQQQQLHHPSQAPSSQQVHHHHQHHHHFVPPPLPLLPPHQQQHSLHHLQPSPGAHSSRGVSRATFIDDDEEAARVLEEDNLLLVDNSVGVQDAVYLDPVTTDNFLTNIVQRFKRDFIYTYVGEGTLLVSVNPYKPLSIFSPRVKAAYRNISNPFQLPPHIYGQLCLILQRNTSSLERTQTLLLTGESGSGKSTNLSYLLDFLATKQSERSSAREPSRSRRNSGRSTSGAGSVSTRGGSYYLSTGSLHRHQHIHQQHTTSCPHYYTSIAGGGSGRASSLSLTAPAGDSERKSQRESGAVTGSSSNMALNILQGNFLLNAFGNCKTSKNSDASRFGKLVQLQIDFLGNVCGGRVLSYQLEKWRVQGPNNSAESSYERNFHIFYILLAGADSSTLKSLRLTKNLETYAMLNVKNHSSFLNASQTTPSTPFCPHDHYYKVKGSKGQQLSSYEACFLLLKTTLSSILSSSTSCSSSITSDHVFRMLAAILKLNNLVFAPVANIDGTEGCDVTNEQDLQDLGVLLSILPSSTSSVPVSSPSTPNNGNNNHNHQHPLKTILTTRKISRSDGSIVTIELTASESSSLRNSLTVSLYTRLFAWLTKQVNFSPFSTASSTGRNSSASHTAPSQPSKYNLLNIVDFYGFEVFQTNSIEQFLINFTNEKIQFVLADLRLRMLQEEFVTDGLEWITIDTAGATPTGSSSSSGQQTPGKLIDLIEENCHGLLSIFANCANDHELERQFSRRFTFPSSKDEKDPPTPTGSKTSPTGNTVLVEYLHQSFRLRHWAGPVVYSTRHFATKNRDTLPPHLPHQLYTWTSDPLLRSLFSHDGRSSAPVDSTSSRLLATSNMELSLRNLFQKCCSSSKYHRIYYIRCLKPNELSQPDVCELALLKHQVKYHRLIDFVRVYRDGFCYNIGAFEFLERYKLLSLNTWPNWRIEHDVKLGIQVLMKDLQMKEGLDWCFGGNGGLGSGRAAENLKVYLKGQRILSELEDFRRERLDDLALLIQKVWKGYRDWRKFSRMKQAYTVICIAWKTYLQCKRKEQRKRWKQMKHSVRLIQGKYILWKRRLFLRQLIHQVRADLQQIGGLSGGAGMYGGCPSLAGTGMLPSVGSMLSPISRDWPYSPSYLEEASFQLRRVFHRWRCRLYRSKFNEIERAKMAEKVTSSLLFKDKKSSYPRSVSHPFLGDYIRLRQNSQWRRTANTMMMQSGSQSSPPLTSVPSASAMSGGLEEQVEERTGDPLIRKQMLPAQPQLQIVFADLINKITRSSGKFLPIVLVVTTTQVLILDPRTFNIKYKIPATEIWRLSMSPFGDDICVLHLQHPARTGTSAGSVMGPGEQGNLFGGVLSDDDDAYYQFGDEPSPTGNFGAGGCVCSSSAGAGGGAGYPPTGAYYAAPDQPSPSSSQQQHQCQPGSGGCGLFGSGGDTDSGHYAAASDVVKLTKGDLVLHTCHLIEMVTKIFLVVKNATGKGPEIVISNEFPAVFNNQRVQLNFRYSKIALQKSVANSSKQETAASSGPPPSETQESGNSQMTRSLPPNLSLLPDGSVPQQQQSNTTPQIPAPPPPPAGISLHSKEEPVIPPSQIKITRKKSTRMEFLIGHS